MSKELKVNVAGKKALDLSKAPYQYVGAGGQASVYQGNGLAFKIYHKPADMIPVGKIQELMRIQAANVIRPIDIVYGSSGDPVGYTMRFLSGTHPLCKLFTKSFKMDNGIDLAMVNALVKALQTTVAGIHRDRCLIVDLNELNVLVDGSFVEPYMIDTDSYQTPSYRATAIMDSIRDRRAPPGRFSEETDWFSFAVIATQLYLNIHPYKGTHPKYLPSELGRRMDDNVSIFDKGVRLPSVCNPFSVVPPRHLDWLKAVFQSGTRTSPPAPDGLGPVAVPANIVLINSTDKFDVQELFSLDADILYRMEWFGVDWYVTRKSVFKDEQRVWNRASEFRRVIVCPAEDGEPIVAAADGAGLIRFMTLRDDPVGQTQSKGMFYRNQAVYTVGKGHLYEHAFVKMGARTFVRTTAVDNVSEFNAELYPGLVVQNLLGRYWLTIPYAAGHCRSLPVPQLDGYRVIDARCERNICVAIGERAGKYDRFILTFGPGFADYTLRCDPDIAYDGINFTVLENGLGVLVGGSELQMFKDATVHKFTNPPIDANMRLFTKSGTVRFLNGNSVYRLQTKR